MIPCRAPWYKYVVLKLYSVQGRTELVRVQVRPKICASSTAILDTRTSNYEVRLSTRYDHFRKVRLLHVQGISKN